MLSADAAILRFRRDLTLGAVLRGLLAAAAGAALMVNFLPIAGGLAGGLPLMIVGGVWLVLSYRSLKGSRIAAESPLLIAAGEFDQAERRIEVALHSFSLFPSTKFLSLHHLALLRHAQKRWQDSAKLCQAILGQKLGTLQGLSKSSRLILANALLELGDLNGAYYALAGLYSERLSLGEAMNLLLVQLDYESRIGAWWNMLPPGAEMTRAQVAELMPTENAARAQALMALAAQRTGRADWFHWLRRRAELLSDPAQLTSERPALEELWRE